MACELVWETPRCIYRKFSGRITDDELVGSVSGIYGDPRFDDLRCVINDFLAVESVAVTPDAVNYVAAIDGAAARSNPSIRIALLMTEAEQKALAQIYVDSPWTVYPTRIFGSADEARAWLAACAHPASNP